MGLGGPVWHCSVAPLPGRRVSWRELRRLALRHLAGVGDMGREWEERGERAYHLRRRLAAAEEAMVGPALDVRGTAEAWRRHEAMRSVIRRATYTDIGVGGMMSATQGRIWVRDCGGQAQPVSRATPPASPPTPPPAS